MNKEGNKLWFFAGAETTNTKFNVFTSSFIKMMGMIAGEDFRYIRDIYYRMPMMNVIWALNNAQKPYGDPSKHKIIRNVFNQVVNNGLTGDSNLILLSSSSGSVVAAQAACYIAETNKSKRFLNSPFHLALGSSMISRQSQLYDRLMKYREEGIIGTIIHDEVQDEGDNTVEMGGTSRCEAYHNAFGIMFPYLSRRYNRPSFLNRHPGNGHIHRRRSMTIDKSLDFINAILIKYALAGEHYKEKAEKMIQDIKNEKIILS